MTKRVGIYLRVSTAEQSTALQASEIARYAASRGWTDLRCYEDAGRTGTNAERPALKAMLKDARQRKLDLIICWKLDRLFRSLKDLTVTLHELNELGVEFVSLKDNIDLTTSSGRLMMHMIGAFAEFEASLVKERVRAGLRLAKERGRPIGRPKIRNDAAIRSLRQQGLSVRQIASQLEISKAAVQRCISVPKPPISALEKCQ